MSRRKKDPLRELGEEKGVRNEWHVLEPLSRVVQSVSDLLSWNHQQGIGLGPTLSSPRLRSVWPMADLIGGDRLQHNLPEPATLFGCPVP